jgi:high-affinity nickel-transport protein
MAARAHRIRSALSRAEWGGVAAMVLAIVALHVVGFGLLFGVVVPAHLDMGAAGVFTVGVGVTAYMLGVRHAFDADHIAAIDNTTRKLMAEGQRPLSVGFYFSLGHSTVVFALALALSFGVKAIAGPVADDSSALQQVTGVIGPVVSATFLWIIAAINVAILVGLLRVIRALRRGHCSSEALAAQVQAGGPMNRLLGRFTRLIRRPWHIYPLGVLFGLGFDTATEISLLFLAGGAAGAGLPWYAILCLPILFAAGMSLFDTIDGSFMNFAYGWGLSKPARKIYYNLIVTVLSIVAALAIGTIELAAVAAGRFGLTGGVWDFAAGADLSVVGYAIVATFVATWLIAIAVWRLGRIEERWAVHDGT